MTITITIHVLNDTIGPDDHGKAFLWHKDWQLLETEKADKGSPVPEQILGLQHFVPSRQLCAEAICEQTPRLDIPIFPQASLDGPGKVPLKRCGRTFQ